MDELVKAAMAKWPNVPHCYGWLGLDARGRWWMRDERAQRAGPFAGPGATAASRGSELRHEKLIAFIERNYGCDEAGQWYFQNGPQRVYVELEKLPWVWRLDDRGEVCSHTGRPAVVQRAWTDEDGWLYLETDLGWGNVHSQDMDRAARLLEAGGWTLAYLPYASVLERAGCVLSPQAAQAAGANMKKPADERAG